MSTTADLVRDLNEFLSSVDELFNTSQAREAPNIARDLGATQQLNSALDLFNRGLVTIEGGLTTVTDSLVQVDSVSAGFEIVAASIVEFGEGRALLEVSELMNLPDAPFETVSGGIAKGGRYLDTMVGVADALPSPSDIRTTGVRLKKLQESVSGLKALPAQPATPALNITQ